AAMVGDRFVDMVDLYCFEPSDSARTKLVARIATDLHNFRAGAGVYAFGLSDMTRTMPLHTDALGSGMASVHHRRLAHFGRSPYKEERISLRPLEPVCAE